MNKLIATVLFVTFMGLWVRANAQEFGVGPDGIYGQLIPGHYPRHFRGREEYSERWHHHRQWRHHRQWHPGGGHWEDNDEE